MKPGAIRADSRTASAARASTDRSTIRFSRGWRCWMLMRRRSIRDILTQRGRAADFAIAEYFDAEGGGFFDRASGAAPMGGLDVRRKPLQDSPTPGANSVGGDSARPPVWLHRRRAPPATRRRRPSKLLRASLRNLEFTRPATGLPRVLHARRPFEVVVTGASGDPRADAPGARRAFRLPLRQGRAARHARAAGGQAILRPRWPKRCRIFARMLRRLWSAWAPRAVRRSTIPPHSSRY